MTLKDRLDKAMEKTENFLDTYGQDVVNTGLVIVSGISLWLIAGLLKENVQKSEKIARLEDATGWLYTHPLYVEKGDNDEFKVTVLEQYKKIDPDPTV